MTNLLLVALMISAAEPDFRPETTDGAKPERRDATLDPKRLKPLPDLPLQKPSRIFGDSRFYTRTHNPAVAASPDGKWLVVGGTFFDRKTGKELFVDWLAASASRLAFSGDSKLLFALNGEHGTHVFDTQTREEVIAIRSKSSAITPDGSRLATIESVHVPTPVNADGIRHAIARLRRVLRVYNTKTWNEVAKYSVNGFSPSAIGISPDGNVLAVGSTNGDVYTWDIWEDKILNVWKELSTDPNGQRPKHNPFGIGHIQFDPMGKWIVAESRDHYHSIGIWSWPEGKLRHRLPPNDSNNQQLRFSPDGQHLIGSGLNPTVWHVESGKIVKSLNFSTYGSGIRSCAFAAEADRLFVGGDLWSFPDLKPLPLLDPPIDRSPPKLPFEILGTLVSSSVGQRHKEGIVLRDMTTLRANNADGGVKLLDGAGQVIRHFEKNRNGGFDVSPDQKTLVFNGNQSNGKGSELTVKFWNIATGAEESRIDCYPRPGYCLVYSPDGKWLAIDHADGVIRIWDVATRAPMRALCTERHEARQFTFSKDGKHLVGGFAESPIVVVWDLND